MSESNITISKQVFSPASIISIFNNALKINEEKKIIIVSGIYKKTGIKSYKGYYYDNLNDEGGGYSLTVISHQLKRQKIENNQSIEFTGYITRGIDKDGSIRIQICNRLRFRIVFGGNNKNKNPRIRVLKKVGCLY